ncbi:unnamed protein product [Linum trigynum]|uniref:Uncharacterized protein n=1 Tax=Linum trigynum TaxID=586398 RepID=A0AAV2CIU9_9ROSI
MRHRDENRSSAIPASVFYGDGHQNKRQWRKRKVPATVVKGRKNTGKLRDEEGQFTEEDKDDDTTLVKEMTIHEEASQIPPMV